MTKKIKLIWEFRGPSAAPTAKHHIIHLEEYMHIEKIAIHKIEAVLVSEFNAMAYVVIDDTFLQKVRTALKPHRGQYYTADN